MATIGTNVSLFIIVALSFAPHSALSETLKLTCVVDRVLALDEQGKGMSKESNSRLDFIVESETLRYVRREDDGTWKASSIHSLGAEVLILSSWSSEGVAYEEKIDRISADYSTFVLNSNNKTSFAEFGSCVKNDSLSWPAAKF